MACQFYARVTRYKHSELKNHFASVHCKIKLVDIAALQAMY